MSMSNMCAMEMFINKALDFSIYFVKRHSWPRAMQIVDINHCLVAALIPAGFQWSWFNYLPEPLIE